MSSETFYDHARQIVTHLLEENPQGDRDEIVNTYAEALTRLHAAESHRLLTEVIEDARTRLDARLSPDPVRQTIASVQTTVQDIWRALWKE